jgi:hypothetical protein
MTNAITYTQALQALRAHRAADTADIGAVLKGKGKFALTEQVFNMGAREFGVDWEIIFSLPQKQIKRTTQTVGALVTGQLSDFDASYLGVILALYIAPARALRYEELLQLVTGFIRDQGTAGDVRGIPRSKLARLLKRTVKPSTFATKLSGSCGNNGVFDTLGVTGAPHGTKNREVYLNENHPMVKKVARLVGLMTDGQIEQIGGEE